MHSPALHAKFLYQGGTWYHRFLWPLAEVISCNIVLGHADRNTALFILCTCNKSYAPTIPATSPLLQVFPEKHEQKALWQNSLPPPGFVSPSLLSLAGTARKWFCLNALPWSKMVIQALQIPVCYKRTQQTVILILSKAQIRTNCSSCAT